MIDACLDTLNEHVGVLPVISVKDTIYETNTNDKMTLLDRGNIKAGQAPEAFWFQPYYQANLRLLPNEIKKITGSTEPAILAGLDIAMIAGEETNIKITTQVDLEFFKYLLSSNKSKCNTKLS